MSSQADLLKAEGNALFVKGDLEAAFAKYTEALGYDDRSAVLYSNRAACCLGLDRCVFIPMRGRIGELSDSDRYLEASTDATKVHEYRELRCRLVLEGLCFYCRLRILTLDMRKRGRVLLQLEWWVCCFSM